MGDLGEVPILRGKRNASEVWLANRSLYVWGSAFAQGFGGRSSFRSALRFEAKTGAGEGNRTLVSSLEGYGFTIKLHPRAG